MIPVFTGFDPREEAGTHVFNSSLLEYASKPVSIIPLHLSLFRGFYKDGHRDGSNAFIYTRFLIPYLQNYTGSAIFVDGADMLMKGDIAELWAMRDFYKPVQVVKHEYKTKYRRKYLGTKMEADNEDYPCKNWSSVMIINCMHMAWRNINPETISKMSGRELHTFSWMRPDQIGELPKIWGWMADEYGQNPEAKLLHFTTGVPAFKNHRHVAHAADYMRQLERVNHVTD